MPDPIAAALTAQIYRAATEPARLTDVLQTLAEEIGAAGWHFLGWDVEEGRDLIGLSNDFVRDARMLEHYDAHFGKVDPRRALAGRTGPGVVIQCDEHFDSRFVARSEFYQDFLRPAGVRCSIGLCLHRTPGVDYQVGFVRSIDRGSYAPRAEQLLNALSAPLMHAVRFIEQWRSLQRQTHLSTAGLETAGVALLGLTVTGRVVHANAAAEALLRQGRPLQWRGQRLAAAQGREQTALVGALAVLASTGQPQTLLVGRDGDAPHCLLLVAAPRDEAAAADGLGSHGDERLLLCIVSPLHTRAAPSVRQLRSLFGLTPAEARLVRALCADETPQSYADSQGVRISTVRTHMYAVFAKTGVTRQSELLRLVGSVPAARDDA